MTIYSISILEINLPEVRIEVNCSKGTYIRTLCHDIGNVLGCGGCMKTLLRKRVERFDVADSITVGEVEALQKEGRLTDKILPIDEMFPEYTKIYLKPAAAKAVRNGNVFRSGDILWMPSLDEYRDGDRVRVYDDERKFIAIYEYRKKENYFKIVRMFFDENEKQ